MKMAEFSRQNHVFLYEKNMIHTCTNRKKPRHESFAHAHRIERTYTIDVRQQQTATIAVYITLAVQNDGTPDYEIKKTAIEKNEVKGKRR